MVRLSKLDYYYFPRFLEWLQLSQQYNDSLQDDNSLIKEWSISNTTLEQVFLLLSETNQVNYTGNVQNGQQQTLTNKVDMICPLCESNMKAPIAFIPHITGKRLMLPNSICDQCEAIPHFLIGDEEYTPLLKAVNEDQKRSMVAEIFRNAQHKRVSTINESAVSSTIQIEDEFRSAILTAYENHGQNDIEIGNLPPIQNNTEPDRMNTSSVGIQQHEEANIITPVSVNVRMGNLQDIIAALAIKNLRLQKYQKRFNCCLLFFEGLVLLAIFVIGFLWQVDEICPQGNTVGILESCDIDSQSKFLFAFDSSEDLNYFPNIPSNLEVDVRVYLAPRTSESFTDTYIKHRSNS